MSIAAVPRYLADVAAGYQHAPPGHRFSLYLEAWNDDYLLDKPNKTNAFKKVLAVPDASGSMLEVLRDRQDTLARNLGADTFDAICTAPFATGLGNEHPLENGFAFLNPYGLPYLPGSGVKGVLRKAAWELGDGIFGVEQQDGWTADAIKVLFGVEDGEGDPQRGALSFWDVIPQLKGDSLKVDVMTVHQTHYYQKGDSPHDSGSPNPIYFLTVPPGSAFTFHVQCNQRQLARFAPTLAEGDQWKALLHAAFGHAFDWLGFGAKTAVGYGAMQFDKKAATAREAQKLEREEAALRAAQAEAREAQLAILSPVDRKIAEAVASKQPGQSDDSAVFNAIKAGGFGPDERREAAQKLKSMMIEVKSWKETTAAKKPEKDKEYGRTLEVKKWLES